jgi:hypothetical protein
MSTLWFGMLYNFERCRQALASCQHPALQYGTSFLTQGALAKGFENITIGAGLRSIHDVGHVPVINHQDGTV